jgi:uncharacterized protein (DUF433 family)
MQVEDYFDFLAPDDIRIKGHRIGIESVLLDYLDQDLTPEAIRDRYPRLSLEQVYGTILYYWQNKEVVQTYLDDYRESASRRREEFTKTPPPFVQRLTSGRQERASAIPAKGAGAA